MDFTNDPNSFRQDRWFSLPEDAIPYLQWLCITHPEDAPEILSAALLQARKNVVTGSSRDLLKLETERLLRVHHRWDRVLAIRAR